MSISKGTYERLRAYCETNGVPMSKFIEMRIGDYLGRSQRTAREDSEDSARKAAERIFTF